MKKFALLLFFAVAAWVVKAQLLNPVKWSTTYKQVSDTEFDLIFTASIDNGWYVYSQYLQGDDGPIPTTFYYDEDSHFELVGKNKESGNRKEGFDKVFKMNVAKFSSKGVFTQRVRVKDFSKPIKGYVEYMTCNDEQCLPPTEENFSFELVAKPIEKASTDKKTSVQAGTNQASQTPPVIQQAPDNVAINTPPSNPVNPVSWSASIQKISDDEFNLSFKASLQKGWYIYSQFLSEDGPVPTRLDFNGNDHIELVGKSTETSPKVVKGYDPLFGMNLTKFKQEATFTQRIKIKTKEAGKMLQGFVEYAICDDSKCLPTTEVNFRADLINLNIAIGSDIAIATAEEIVPLTQDAVLFSNFPKPNLTTPAGECSGEALNAGGKSNWTIFLLGLVGGFLALLTPCVFPMIPLTVSFFTKSSQNRRKGILNASMYGFFIFAVYALLSIPFHLMDNINPDILNEISTNVWLNVAFFVIFLIFAFSFFGYYELTLPSSWVNKTSSAEGLGGMLGIFFMALTLALVSFSCTGPILGALLAGALTSDGGAWQLTAGMSGFGLALALPFALFAAFPGWMNSLPKSGGWLNTVKVTLGFIELALALKFLSNADMVKHWGVLKVEPFLALWIVLALGLGLYLLGRIRFPHDSPLKKLSVGRILLAAGAFAFTAYLSTGFIYDDKIGSLRPLKLLSGLAPPACYSFFYPCDCPQNLNCFKDFNEGLAYAKEVNKPIMLDFTGYACVNCRKMEEHVWPLKEVNNYLKNDYVLISLYVDDKKGLPEEERIEVPKYNGGTRVNRNYGHKWQYFQMEYFGTVAQPYYVLVSPDGQLLNQPVGYTPDAQEYAAFLQCGLDTFKKLAAEKTNKLKILGSNE